MVRGSQRKVVFLKNTDSEIFEEAFFILKDEVGVGVCEGDILREANRIIEESLEYSSRKTKSLSPKKRTLIFIIRSVLPFLLGVGISLFCLLFL